MPKRGFDGGFELGRDFHGRCSFREGLAMAAPHGAGMLPLYVGDLPGRRLQAVFSLYPCVDFLIGREAADLDITYEIRIGKRFLVCMVRS